MKTILLICALLSMHIAVAQTPDELFKSALDARQKGNLKESVKLLDAAIHQDSLQANYYNVLSDVLIQMKLYEAALSVYNLAIDLMPDSAETYLNRGLLLMGLGEFEYSIQDFTNGMEYATTDTMRLMFLTDRSSAKLYIREYEGAYADLINAYLIDSLNKGVLLNLGTVCDEVGRGDETMKYYEKVLEIDPTDFVVMNNIGFKYQFMGDHAKAIEYFDRSIAIHPDGFAYSNRAYSKLQLGKTKEALKDINTSIKLDPGNSYAFRNRALIYIQMEKLEDACVDIETALQKGFTLTYGEEVEEMAEKYCK